MSKKILSAWIMTLGIASGAFAEDFVSNEYASSYNNSNCNIGIYFGGQLGMSNMHYGSKYTIPGNTVENNKLAGRIYLGYIFSQFISAELAYDYYGRPKFKAVDGNTQDILQHGGDLIIKGTLPLDYGFGLYAKGGAALIHRSALHSNRRTFAEKEEDTKVTPVGGIGVNYWFAPNIALDLSWTKTMTIGDLPTTDFFLLGINYKINL
jgi:OOP family OmpA-OmpF porin